MAAITRFMESQEDLAAHPSAPLGAARASLGELPVLHAQLIRQVWSRQAIERAIAGRTVSFKNGEDGLRLELDQRIPRDASPWERMAADNGGASILTKNTKMACPSFDLASGSPIHGGTCPAATEYQSVVPRPPRHTSDEAVASTICQSCYAERGHFGRAVSIFGTSLRTMWTRQSMETTEGRDRWVEVMVRAIATSGMHAPTTIDGRDLRPVRVHSSGDFFSPEYLAAWVEVANRLAASPSTRDIVLWAPTRVWTVREFKGVFATLERANPSRNLVVRPSALRVNDDAPMAIAGTAAGTTAILKSDQREMQPDLQRAAEKPVSAGGEVDRRFEWSCQAYAVKSEKHSCAVAASPSGRKGCRVCWTDPSIRINYTLH